MVYFVSLCLKAIGGEGCYTELSLLKKIALQLYPTMELRIKKILDPMMEYNLGTIFFGYPVYGPLTSQWSCDSSDVFYRANGPAN